MAFAEVSSVEQFQKAIKALNYKEIDGRRLAVRYGFYSTRQQFEDQEKMNSEAKELKRCDPCEIFIADFPDNFIEIDLSNLFQEYGIEISNIRLRHNGIHP